MATRCKQCGGMVPDYGPHVCGQWAASHIEKLKADNIKLEAEVGRLKFENAEIKGMSKDVIGSLVDKAQLVATNYELRETVKNLRAKWDYIVSYITSNPESSIDRLVLHHHVSDLNTRYCECHIGKICDETCKIKHHDTCIRGGSRG